MLGTLSRLGMNELGMLMVVFIGAGIAERNGVIPTQLISRWFFELNFEYEHMNERTGTM